MIHSIDKNANASEKEAFIAVYMDIWNHPDNLPFQSSTICSVMHRQMPYKSCLESGANHQAGFRF